MNEHLHPTNDIRHLGIALGITLSFFFIEMVGGILTNSLALLTDAWHMLNDAFALASAIIVTWLARRPATNKRTYGYYRAEVVAAFLNGILLWVIVVLIFYEAFQRFQHPSEVESLNMLIIAFSGLAANGLAALTLSRLKDESLNIKGAFLHVLTDTLGSVGVISAGLIMFFTGWYQADPLFSVVIGILIFYSSGKLIRESLNMLLEGVPSRIDATDMERRIAETEGVRGVHDLHVWCVTPTRTCLMSTHVVVEKGVDRRRLMTILINMLKEEFGVDHPTIQFEDEGYPKAVSEH